MIKLVVFDLDNVLINTETIDEIAKIKGIEKEISDITLQAMQGKIPFEESIRQRVKKLEGIPTAEIDEVMEIIETNFDKAVDLVTNMIIQQNKNFYIKKGTKIIGKNALLGMNFQYILLPDSIEEIDETAFYYCFNLMHIEIPSYQYSKIYNILPSYLREYVIEDNELPF